MSYYPHVDQHHTPHVERARAEAGAAPCVRALLGDELDADEQLGVLIDLFAVSVRLLRPFEDHLVKGVATCDDAGFDSIAADLWRLGKDTAGRRLRVIDDLVQLSMLWRERGGPTLDLGALVRRPTPAAGRRQLRLREAAAADSLPFELLGIELEQACFAIEFGPKLLRASERKLGSVVLERLSYLQAWTEHAALRADDLLERLDDLLRAVPELGEPMANAGLAMLDAQLELFAACIERGRRLPPSRSVQARL